MLITFTSIKNGQGQTTTAINTAIYLKEITEKNILLVDLNGELNKYFKNNIMLKSFDDFINQYNVKENSLDYLKFCINNLDKNIDIIGPHKYLNIDGDVIDAFIKQAKKNYGYILVDTNNNEESNIFIDKSDINIMVTDQSKRNIKNIIENKVNVNKTIYVINKYMNSIKYKIKDIEDDLIKIIPTSIEELNTEINKQFVFQLEFEKDILNFINEDTLGSFIPTTNSIYKDSLKNIIIKILHEDNSLNSYPNLLKIENNTREDFFDKLINKLFKEKKKEMSESNG